MGASPLVSVNIETFLRFRRLALAVSQNVSDIISKSGADFTTTTLKTRARGIGQDIFGVDHLRFLPHTHFKIFSGFER